MATETEEFWAVVAALVCGEVPAPSGASRGAPSKSCDAAPPVLHRSTLRTPMPPARSLARYCLLVKRPLQYLGIEGLLASFAMPAIPQHEHAG